MFENTFSPHIPTTPGYGSMFTGMDCFGMNVVALRHEGGLLPSLKTLAEVLGEEGYNTTCVGFSGNPASRGFQKYLDFSGWGSWEAGRSPKAENLNAVTLPELRRLASEEQPFFLFMRHMDPHSPYLPPRPFERIFYGGNEADPANRSLDPVMAFKPFCDYFASWFPPGCTDKEYIIAQYDGASPTWTPHRQPLAECSAGDRGKHPVVINSDTARTSTTDCFYDHTALECTTRIPDPRSSPAGSGGHRSRYQQKT